MATGNGYKQPGITKAFWSAKPYSLGLNEATALFAAAAVGKGGDHLRLALVTAASLAMWFCFNWLSDFLQKEKQKPRVPLAILVAIVAVSAILAPSPWSLALLAGYILSIALYAFKSRSTVLGPLGPVLRGITVFAQCLWLGAVANPAVFPREVLELPLLFLVVLNARRNYVGDIRDRETDRWELPARIKPATSLLILCPFSLAIAMFAWIAFGPLLGLAMLTIELVTLGYLSRRLYQLGYAAHKSHRAYIVLDTTTTATAAWLTGCHPIWAFSCVILAVFLTSSYSQVPGKNYMLLKKRTEDVKL